MISTLRLSIYTNPYKVPYRLIVSSLPKTKKARGQSNKASNRREWLYRVACDPLWPIYVFVSLRARGYCRACARLCRVCVRLLWGRLSGCALQKYIKGPKGSRVRCGHVVMWTAATRFGRQTCRLVPKYPKWDNSQQSQYNVNSIKNRCDKNTDVGVKGTCKATKGYKKGMRGMAVNARSKTPCDLIERLAGRRF